MDRHPILVVIIFTLLIASCKGDKEQQQPEAGNEQVKDNNSLNLNRYLHEAFGIEIPKDQHYFLLFTEQMCAMCEEPVFAAFNRYQPRLRTDRLTLITDFPCNDPRIDTNLSETCRCDSSKLFHDYSFPRSYGTLYKTRSGKIDAYVFISKAKEFESFLVKEDLLK